jgi:hypothetical protein
MSLRHEIKRQIQLMNAASVIRLILIGLPATSFSQASDHEKFA